MIWVSYCEQLLLTFRQGDTGRPGVPGEKGPNGLPVSSQLIETRQIVVQY